MGCLTVLYNFCPSGTLLIHSIVSAVLVDLNLNQKEKQTQKQVAKFPIIVPPAYYHLSIQIQMTISAANRRAARY